LKLTLAVEEDLKNLIGQIPVSLHVVQDQLEELALDSQTESTGRGDTD
jgi:hypothetical protein